jgi:hypothetical protein
MGSLQSAHHSSEHRETARHPAACVALTIAVATVFWAGLIWAALRLYG